MGNGIPTREEQLETLVLELQAEIGERNVLLNVQLSIEKDLRAEIERLKLVIENSNRTIDAYNKTQTANAEKIKAFEAIKKHLDAGNGLSMEKFREYYIVIDQHTCDEFENVDLSAAIIAADELGREQTNVG